MICHATFGAMEVECSFLFRGGFQTNMRAPREDEANAYLLQRVRRFSPARCSVGNADRA